MMEIRCSSCGAKSISLTTFKCEFCGTVNDLSRDVVKQIEQAEEKENKSLKEQKAEIEERVRKNFNFIPESHQIGPLASYPKYIAAISVAGIVVLYAIFTYMMWLWYQNWYLNWDRANGTFLEAASDILLADEAWVFLIITALTVFLLFKGFNNLLRINLAKRVGSFFISVLLAWVIMDLIALATGYFEESMMYLFFIDGGIFYRWTGEMLMMYYLVFSAILLFITHRIYKKLKMKQRVASGISEAVDLTKVPRLNPALGLAELERMGAWDIVTYEQGLTILLTANIPFNIARDALKACGLSIRVDTIKERLRNPFVVDLRT